MQKVVEAQDADGAEDGRTWGMERGWRGTEVACRFGLLNLEADRCSWRGRSKRTSESRDQREKVEKEQRTRRQKRVHLH